MARTHSPATKFAGVGETLVCDSGDTSPLALLAVGSGAQTSWTKWAGLERVLIVAMGLCVCVYVCVCLCVLFVYWGWGLVESWIY